jgi:hypothetical protein
MTALDATVKRRVELIAGSATRLSHRAPPVMIASASAARRRPTRVIMLEIYDSPSSENELYLKLFITNGGGW